jgi:hypothetical protein
LTRFVFFDKLSESDLQRHRTIAEIEAVALDHSQVDTPLNSIYHALATAYEQHGFPNAIREHHQGEPLAMGRGRWWLRQRQAIASPPP